MARALLALVLTATAALAAAPAGGRSVPPTAQNVRWWLGTWDTNFGRLFFRDVYRARSDYPGPHDEVQYYWRAEGLWTMPDGRARLFHGAIDGRDHLVFQGCYQVGQDCRNPMLMYGNESRDRIAHGFWKACPLATNCPSHHPWQGERKARRWRIGFRFTQRGLPDGHTTIRTQTGGAGTLVWPQAPIATPNDPGKAVHGSTLLTIDEVPGAEPLSVTVELRRGFVKGYGPRRDPTPTLVLEGVVAASNDPHCRPGQYAAATIADRSAGKPDRIELRIDGCRTEHWTSADRNRVSVHVEDPRQG